MKKKYKCRLSGTNILVKVNGKVVRLEFEPDVITSTGHIGCSYSTSNKAIQEAVEKHPRFNAFGREGIWTDSKEEGEVKTVKESSNKKNKRQ